MKSSEQASAIPFRSVDLGGSFSPPSNVAPSKSLGMKLGPRELIERVIERLQMDIDDGGRPDQWSMEGMQRDLRAALSADKPV